MMHDASKGRAALFAQAAQVREEMPSQGDGSGLLPPPEAYRTTAFAH